MRSASSAVIASNSASTLPHFRGKRRWSDSQLERAVTRSHSWDEVLVALGLSANSGNIRPHLKGHAVRLGLDMSHLSSGVRVEPSPCAVTPALEHLRDAGPAIAAGWFTLGGCSVLFPVEPTTYDLVASMPDGLRRVQVKTTTSKGRDGWQASVGRRSGTHKTGRVPYDPDVIDYFFIIDGDLNMYLIRAGSSRGGSHFCCARMRRTSSGTPAGCSGQRWGHARGRCGPSRGPRRDCR